MKSGLIVTLDGPSGSGKSTIAARLALHFKIPNLDTGAMYRCVALRGLESGVSLSDEASLVELAKRIEFEFGLEGDEPYAAYRMDGGAFQKLGREIRTNEVSMAASTIAKLKELRKVLVSRQREIGARVGAIVEGRDAGSVIFPHAPIKFYMTASTEERARRRYEELVSKLGDSAPSFKDVHDEMIKRDLQDSSRVESPLKPAEDAIWVDTTGVSLDQVFQRLVAEVEKKSRV